MAIKMELHFTQQTPDYNNKKWEFLKVASCLWPYSI